MVVGTFFAAQWRSTVLVSLYAIGILMAALVSRIFATFIIKGEDTPFVMELPPYRWPTAQAIGRHTWEKGKEYLKKMGGIILVASILVWALSYFGPTSQNEKLISTAPSMEASYLGRMGKGIEPPPWVFSMRATTVSATTTRSPKTTTNTRICAS